MIDNLEKDFEICIAGKNNIAVNVLNYLLYEKSFHKERIYVVCDKDDDGKNTMQRSLRFFSTKENVSIVRLEEIYPKKKLLFLSLEFDKIIKPSSFQTKSLYNLHFSLLPKYKGMYTSAIPLLFGEKRGGVTFHEIDNGIDTGKIVAQENFQIEEEDTCRDVYLKNIYYGTRLMKRIIDGILAGTGLPEAVPQTPYGSSYFSKGFIDYNNLMIKLNTTAQDIYNQIRAYSYREYQMPEVHGIKISQAVITDIPSRQKPGNIIWRNDEQIIMATIDYDIILYVDKFSEVMRSCREGDLDRIKKIPNLKIYLNQSEEGGWAPLMIAVNSGYYDLSIYLLYAGSDINMVNWEGTNLLMCAKDGYQKTGDPRLFQLFIEMGLKKEDRDHKGKSLIDHCRERKVSQIGYCKIY